VAYRQVPHNKAAITEESLQQIFSTLKQHVAERNIPEIKKFIGGYADEVIIYKHHFELILKLKVMEMQKPQPHTVVVLNGGGETRLCKTTNRRNRIILNHYCGVHN